MHIGICGNAISHGLYYIHDLIISEGPELLLLKISSDMAAALARHHARPGNTAELNTSSA